MDAQAGPSRLPAPTATTPQARRSTDRFSPATPNLTHKDSMISATDTFATATDGEGYYTDAADISAYQNDDARSRAGSDSHTIDRHGNEAISISRPRSVRTAQRHDMRADPIGTNTNPVPTLAPIAVSQEASTTSTASNTPPYDLAGQIEPNHLSPPAHHKIMRHLSILSLLAFASIWGTLARQGLSALNTYDGQSVTPLVWSQAVGCLIMGLAIANKEAVEGWYPPIYIMITTGFCGSVTTLSAWMLDVFRAFGDQEHYNRGGLHNVMDALTQTGVTLGMAIVSVGAGIGLGKVLNVQKAVGAYRSRFGSSSLPEHEKTNEGQGNKVEPGDSLFLDTSMLLLGLAFWVASAILCALYPPFRRVTFAIVLAPPGAILRWYLSRYNSHPLSKRHSLPLGTLAANLLATAVICGAFTASRAGSIPQSFAGGLRGCEALQGLQDGFCGTLSTVSTFAVELRSIKPRRKAVRYAVVSWVAGVLICVLLVGAPWWSIGMDGRCLGL